MLELYGPQANQRGIEGDRRGNFLNAFFGIYPCADGHAGLCILPRNYDRMAAAVGIPELQGVAYADPSARLENEDFLQALMYGWFADKTRKEIFDLGIATQFPTGYVATIEDLMESEHLNGRGFFTEEDHPQAGALKYPRSVVGQPGAALAGRTGTATWAAQRRRAARRTGVRR